MSSEITYGRMHLADRDKVLALLRSGHPNDARQGDRRFWDWHYVDHPNSPPGKLPIWLAKCGDKVVGQLATIPVGLNIADETVPAVWVLDLLVDPGFRRRGIMKRLVTEAAAEYPFMLATATRRQHSADMFVGLGWTVFSDVPRYHKLLFPGNALREAARVPPVRALANVVSAPLRLGAKRRAEALEHVRGLDAIDARLADLFAECRRQWGCSITRDVNYLKWLFERQPDKRYETLGYYDDRDGKLLGYAVLYFRKARAGVIDKAAISDICYHPRGSREIIDGLIAASLQLAIERRSGALVTDAIDPLVESRLRASGFWQVKSGQEIMATAPRHREVLFDVRKWHFTRADSDISIFEEPNL